MIPDTPHGWGTVGRTLHWLMALLILGMFALGWTAVNYPMSPAKLQIFAWHKSIGLSLLALVVVRILWRLSHGTPTPPPGTSAAERGLARAGHVGLYFMMILMPVSGYVVNSTANFPLRFFGGFRVPNLIPADKTWQELAESVHLAGFWAFSALILVHVLAALRHHYLKKNDVLLKMLPGKGGPG